MSTDPVATVTNGTSATAHDAPAQPSSYKVFAGNLAYATTEEGLKTFFAPVASEIVTAQVIYRGKRAAGYGFVAFSSLEAAEKAVAELDRKELDGRSVIVQLAKPAEVKERDRSEKKSNGRDRKRIGRRGNKAPLGEVTEAEASGEQETDKSADQAVSTVTDPKSKKPKKTRKIRRPRKTANQNGDGTQPADTNAAETGESESQKEGTGEKQKKSPKPRRVARAPRAPRPEGEAPPGDASKNMIFVANLAFEVDDNALAEIFTSAGIKVISARVVKRRFGHPQRRSKGFGFVDVGDEAEQQRAIELTQGKEVNGREIVVKVAVNAPKETHEGADDAAHDPIEKVEEATAAN